MALAAPLAAPGCAGAADEAQDVSNKRSACRCDGWEVSVRSCIRFVASRPAYFSVYAGTGASATTV